MAALDLLQGWPVGRAAGVVLRRPIGHGSGGGGPVGDGPGGRSPGGGGPVMRWSSWGDETAVYPWASITKLATALAVWVAVEEGSVSLEEPAGPPGATVAHLLAHASGLGPDGTVLAGPARRRIYSNAGYQALTAHLARATAIPFAAYLVEGVLGPLGMDRCSLDPAGGGASGLYGSLDDLAALAGELLHPRLVATATVARATAVAFPGLPGVLPGFGRQEPCDWGLGPELRGHKHPHWTGRDNAPATFGHFGQAGGFLWVDPVRSAACGVLTDRPFGPWAAQCWPELADAVLAELTAST